MYSYHTAPRLTIKRLHNAALRRHGAGVLGSLISNFPLHHQIRRRIDQSSLPWIAARQA
jgi:hypothetical protein